VLELLQHCTHEVLMFRLDGMTEAFQEVCDDIKALELDFLDGVLRNPTEQPGGQSARNRRAH